LPVGQDQRTASQVAIDVSPAFPQSIQNGSGSVLVRNVETPFPPLKAGSQVGQGRPKLLFVGLVDKAKMFVQTQATCQLGQTRKILSIVAHARIPRRTTS
jgi:hypothetical protein